MPPKSIYKQQDETKYQMPKRYKVLMYNDDFTPMELVVEILEQIFDKNYNDAISMMLGIHKGNYAVVGIYSKDIAKTKARKAEDWARKEGFPLRVTAVEE